MVGEETQIVVHEHLEKILRVIDALRPRRCQTFGPFKPCPDLKPEPAEPATSSSKAYLSRIPAAVGRDTSSSHHAASQNSRLEAIGLLCDVCSVWDNHLRKSRGSEICYVYHRQHEAPSPVPPLGETQTATRALYPGLGRTRRRPQLAPVVR